MDPQTVVSATEHSLISCLECPLGDRPSVCRRSRYLQDEQCVNYSADGQIYVLFGSAAELLIMSQEQAPCKPQANGTSRGPTWQNNVMFPLVSSADVEGADSEDGYKRWRAIIHHHLPFPPLFKNKVQAMFSEPRRPDSFSAS